MSRVTGVPVRDERKIARSRATHMARIESAPDQVTAVKAAFGRLWAIFRRGDFELNEIVGAETVSALTRIADNADSEWAERRKRHGSAA